MTEPGTRAVSLAPVVPSADLAKAVDMWSALLGTRPTFVGGGRWAQFDLDSGRLSLAGDDRATSSPAVMVKVGDVERARAGALALGLRAGELESGAHEVRCVVSGPDGWDVIFYTPATR